MNKINMANTSKKQKIWNSIDKFVNVDLPKKEKAFNEYFTFDTDELSDSMNKISDKVEKKEKLTKEDTRQMVRAGLCIGLTQLGGKQSGKHKKK